MIEIKSQDVKFLKEDFLYKSEIQKEIKFYENEDLGHWATIKLVEVEEVTPKPLEDSRRGLQISELILPSQGSQES